MLIVILVVVWMQNQEANREMDAPSETGRPSAPGWLEALSGDPGEPISADLEARILALLANGRKIEAVKIYRNATGVGLKEAKEAVEAIEESA